MFQLGLNSCFEHIWRVEAFAPIIYNSPAFQQAQTQELLAAELLRCHQNGSVDDPENNFVMNRSNRVRTVSITQVTTNRDRLVMHYVDLLNDQTPAVAAI